MHNRLFFCYDFKYYLLNENLKLFEKEKIDEVLYELQEHAYIFVVKMINNRKGFEVLKENCNKFGIDKSELVDILFGIFSRKEK